MTVDFGYNWHFGTAAPSGIEFDFRTVALHEITHSLGFASVIDEVSGDGLNVTDGGNFFGDTYSTFDSFLVDGSSTQLINPAPIDFNAAFTDGTDDDNIIDVFTSGAIYFNGPNAVAAYGGPIPLYAPAIYQAGSSTSHFDTTDPTLAGDPMLHSIGVGDIRRTYSDLNIGVLQDIGYSIILPVPEPSSATLLGASLLCLFGIRRRK